MDAFLFQRIAAIEPLAAKAKFKSVGTIGSTAGQAKTTMTTRLVGQCDMVAG